MKNLYDAVQIVKAIAIATGSARAPPCSAE